MKAKKTMRSFCFLILVFIGMLLCGKLFIPWNGIISGWEGFYQQPDNSVDLLFVGNSHSFASFVPEVFEGELNVLSYNISSNSQNIIQTYYNVKEAIRVQSPSIIVLEALALSNNDNWRPEDKWWSKEANFDGMKFSAVKIEAMREQYLPQNYVYAMFPFWRNHPNWSDFQNTASNMNRMLSSEPLENCKGYTPYTTTMTEQTIRQYKDMKYDPSKYLIHQNQRKHFEMLATLCKENHIQLVVVMAPMYDEYIKKINYPAWASEIQLMCKEADVQYIDYNLIYDQVGFDFSCFNNEFNSYHHLNAKGAELLSRDLAQKLQ